MLRCHVAQAASRPSARSRFCRCRVILYILKLCAFNFIANTFVGSFPDVVIKIFSNFISRFSLWMSLTSCQNGPHRDNRTRELATSRDRDQQCKLKNSSVVRQKITRILPSHCKSLTNV